MKTEELLTAKYKKLLPFLDKKQKQLILAVDAKRLGRGGISKVSLITGVSRLFISTGLRTIRNSG
ncbi:hypothetical protein [Foetidibacter luteolus]|uniref:hypothetical protein n=1 Tax=Foetidibacter luteolus TaxID=2608880 RepID=UPI00129A8A4E|nr:hypothetical protein [Foetidibacter luteolus]